MNAFLARLKGYRTIAAAAVFALIGALELSPWQALVPAEYSKVALVVIPATFAVLRVFTSTKLGERT